MNIVKFRKDRKHKSCDKRRIVEVHCELLQVSLLPPHRDDSCTILVSLSLVIFNGPAWWQSRVPRPANSENIYTTRIWHFGADFGSSCGPGAIELSESSAKNNNISL